LLDRNHCSAEELTSVDARIADEVEAAAIVAEQSDFPKADDIKARVFVQSVTPLSTEHTPTTASQITYHQAIQDALKEEMDRDPSLFIIGEDIGISGGAFKITAGFSKRYDQLDWNEHWNSQGPFTQRRVIDAPIAEAGFCGLALGAALCGLRSVVEFQYADFSSEAFKMIVNYAATQTVRCMGPVPVVFRMPSGWAPTTGIYHSVNPESWFASTPGLKIVAPISAFDAKGLLKSAIRDGNPVLYLEYKGYYRVPPDRLPPELNIPVPGDDYIVAIGKARVLRSGSDISVITFGSQVIRALEAARMIEKEQGASVELIDLRSLVPYDSDAIRESVEKTGRVLVTCEAPRTGCFGNTIVAEIIRSSFDFLEAPVRLVAAADTPVPFSPPLETAHLPTTERLIAAMRELLDF
jgi:pyruvate/2-oxoglutarate/acetoin dehydrogenase E1 component